MIKCTTADRLNQIMSNRNLKQIDILNMVLPYCQQYKIKMGRNDISQYVSGKVVPRQNKLYVLAKALDVNETWLMGFDVSPERNYDSNSLETFSSPASSVTKPVDALIDQLNNEGIKKAVDYITDLLDNPKYKKKQKANDEPIRAIGIDNTLKAAAYEGKGIIDDTLKHT